MSRRNINYKRGSGLFDTITNFFSPAESFNNVSKKTLKTYGDLPIINIEIKRCPIQSFIEPVLNLISLGEWQKAKGESIDKLFHLQMFCTVVLPNQQQKIITVEKNEVINITDKHNNITSCDYFLIPISRPFTLNDMLSKAEKNVGKSTFFRYDGLKNNCFMFVKYLLEAEGLYGTREKDFLFTDLTGLVDRLNKKAPHLNSIMNLVTNIAGTFNKLSGGKHKEIIKHYHNLGYKLHDVVINKDVPFEIAVKEAHKIIKGNKHYYRETKNTYRFRNIAKEKFKPNTFRSKKINKHITLIFGQLKNI